jgi:MbtH protein
MTMDPDDETAPFAVVVNHEEQYSIWPDDGRVVPGGWRATGFRGTRRACLDHIAEVWTDMRPSSLRQRASAEESS